MLNKNDVIELVELDSGININKKQYNKLRDKAIEVHNYFQERVDEFIGEIANQFELDSGDVTPSQANTIDEFKSVLEHYVYNNVKDNTLKFKDLEEGKTYENIANLPNPYVAKTRYKIKNGLLWTIQDNDYSVHNQKMISGMRFKEIIQVSDEEKQLLSLIDDRFEWIVINKNNSIFVHTNKPFKGKVCWDSIRQLELSRHLSLECFNFNFDFLSWEDEEPTRISDLLD